MRRILVLLPTALLALGACQDRPTEPAGVAPSASRGASSNTNVVHVVYLVPSDRAVQKRSEKALTRAIESLQIWYRNALGTGESFSLAKPIVQVYTTAHSASWYATQPNDCGPALFFWCNVLDEGFALTHGSFSDAHNIWIFYIDADPGCGQATGGAAGVALLPANDLRGISGAATVDVCTGAPQPDQGVDRWVGGLGHELGHAFGLPHPPDCDPVQLPSCPVQAIMWLGYLTYPDAFLTDSEKTFLEESPFFSALHLPARLPNVGRHGAYELPAAENGAH
jgi:hypothetical protein